jgi:fructose-bisphosphate aldolase class II
VQTTPAARSYAGATMMINMIKAASIMYPKAIFALHLDHGDMPTSLQAILENAYQSIMIDGSHLSFEENVSVTQQVTKAAHQKSIHVEAELGVLGGVEDGLSPAKEKILYTNPDDVVEFVQRTNADSLAIAVGTSHGAYKLSSGQGLQFRILKEIQDKLPEYPLVLHGCSNVSATVIERINKAGGKLHPDAKGISTEEMIKSINYGVCKINIATDFRLLWTMVNREFFKDEPEQFAPLIPGGRYKSEFETAVLEKFDLLKATGKGVDFK